jgi:hypothetical protein
MARNAARNPCFAATTHAFYALYANALETPKLFGDAVFMHKRGAGLTLAPIQTRYQAALRPEIWLRRIAAFGRATLL